MGGIGIYMDGSKPHNQIETLMARQMKIHGLVEIYGGRRCFMFEHNSD